MAMGKTYHGPLIAVPQDAKRPRVRTGPLAPAVTLELCISVFVVTVLAHRRRYRPVLRGRNVRIGYGLRAG